MEKFEVGKEYTGSFNYDMNCKVTIYIEKRTATTVSYYQTINE